jgi:hypothetical protein
MATKKELIELLRRTTDCLVWIDDDSINTGYTQCPWCYCEARGSEKDHYKDCLIYDIEKAIKGTVV